MQPMMPNLMMKNIPIIEISNAEYLVNDDEDYFFD